jgi:hypothetical protein
MSVPLFPGGSRGVTSGDGGLAVEGTVGFSIGDHRCPREGFSSGAFLDAFAVSSITAIPLATPTAGVVSRHELQSRRTTAGPASADVERTAR